MTLLLSLLVNGNQSSQCLAVRNSIFFLTKTKTKAWLSVLGRENSNLLNCEFFHWATLIRMSTMKPKLFWIQIWWYVLDFPHNIRIIGPIEIFVCCFLTLLSLCPLGCLSLEKINKDSLQGRALATSGCNEKKIQLGQSYSYINKKVWYHQI